MEKLFHICFLFSVRTKMFFHNLFFSCLNIYNIGRNYLFLVLRKILPSSFDFNMIENVPRITISLIELCLEPSSKSKTIF